MTQGAMGAPGGRSSLYWLTTSQQLFQRYRGTEDRRAIPLLNRALLSRDPLIQAEAAEGLALIGDKASIPLILEACRKAPAHVAGLIAASLVYFDDAAAQAAVDQFLPERDARNLRERVSAGGRPLH